MIIYNVYLYIAWHLVDEKTKIWDIKHYVMSKAIKNTGIFVKHAKIS